jgi:DNA-binding transcriptional regulator YhcF (GntR family)
MAALRCSKCGTEAACNCGAPYVSKAEYAAAHMDPKKSNRMNAKALNVSESTVRQAFGQLREKNAVGKNAVKIKRLSADGKMRRPPKRKKITRKQKEIARANREWEANSIPQERWEWAFIEELNRIAAWDKTWTEQFGDWRQFNFTECTYQSLIRAAAVLNGLLGALKKPEATNNVVHYKQRGA